MQQDAIKDSIIVLIQMLLFFLICHLCMEWIELLVLRSKCLFDRFSKKNLVVWGLWQGRTKPAMSTFLTPFLSCAQSLRKQGEYNVELLLLLLNHHNLMHLAKFVKCWGPLWAWSCFGFEGMNGSLTKFIHGTGMIGKQVIFIFKKITVLQAIILEL